MKNLLSNLKSLSYWLLFLLFSLLLGVAMERIFTNNIPENWLLFLYLVLVSVFGIFSLLGGRNVVFNSLAYINGFKLDLKGFAVGILFLILSTTIILLPDNACLSLWMITGCTIGTFMVLMSPRTAYDVTTTNLDSAAFKTEFIVSATLGVFLGLVVKTFFL